MFDDLSGLQTNGQLLRQSTRWPLWLLLRSLCRGGGTDTCKASLFSDLRWSRAGTVLNGLGELARLLGDYDGQANSMRKMKFLTATQPVALVTPMVNQEGCHCMGDYRKAKALLKLKLSNEYGNKNGTTISLAGLPAF
jgi:hypothetical protein